MSSKDVILVLGYARSGTSALTRVISLCGCSLPQAIFGATELNPTGHWEPVEATNLNVEFVSRLGLLADPSMRLQEIDISESVKEEYIGKIRDLLAACPHTPVVIKEFRINELLELWLEAARRAELSAKVVIALRHPQEVFASMNRGFYGGKANGEETEQPCIEKFNTYWLRTNLLAERHSRGLPRVVVKYSNLMKNWREEVYRISNALALDLKADESAIDAFLTPALHRQRYSGPITETFGYSWTTRVYSILSAAALDRPMDLPSLDEIYHAYSACARAFRLSLDAPARDSSSQQLREFVDGLPVWRSEREVR